MAKQPTHPIEEPDRDRPGHGRPDHELPGSGAPGHPGGGAHPDHGLPGPEAPPETESPQPKARRAARDARAAVEPTTSATSLLPPSAAIGDPSFMLRVVGSGFDATSVIVFAGEDEPTTFVSAEELTTGVDMSVWLGPDPAIPVLVRTTLEDGTEEETNALEFAFTEPRAVPLPEAHASQPIPALQLITPV